MIITEKLSLLPKMKWSDNMPRATAKMTRVNRTEQRWVDIIITEKLNNFSAGQAITIIKNTPTREGAYRKSVPSSAKLCRVLKKSGSFTFTRKNECLTWFYNGVEY